MSRDAFDVFDPFDGFVFMLYQKTIFTVFDQFRHAPLIESYDRCATGHGFNDGKAKRFVKMNRVQQCLCISQ